MRVTFSQSANALEPIDTMLFPFLSFEGITTSPPLPIYFFILPFSMIKSSILLSCNPIYPASRAHSYAQLPSVAVTITVPGSGNAPSPIEVSVEGRLIADSELSAKAFAWISVNPSGSTTSSNEVSPMNASSSTTVREAGKTSVSAEAAAHPNMNKIPISAKTFFITVFPLFAIVCRAILRFCCRSSSLINASLPVYPDSEKTIIVTPSKQCVFRYLTCRFSINPGWDHRGSRKQA